MDNAKRDEMIMATHDKVNSIHLILTGTEDQPGLCRDHQTLKTDFYSLRRWLLITAGFIAGGGGLGFGIFELLKNVVR